MIDPNVDPPEGTLEARLAMAMRTIYDPELPVNIYDLGLIYEIHTTAAGEAHIVMTLTAPNCPVAESLPGEVRRAALGVEGVTDANVELTWTPKWTAERLSDAAKLDLEFTGHSGPIGGPRTPFTAMTFGRRSMDRRDDDR